MQLEAGIYTYPCSETVHMKIPDPSQSYSIQVQHRRYSKISIINSVFNCTLSSIDYYSYSKTSFQTYMDQHLSLVKSILELPSVFSSCQYVIINFI